MMTENIRLQRSSMPSRLSRHAVIVAAAGLCLVAAVAARAQQPRSLYDRYTEPIQIFKTGLGTFTKPMSSTNKEAQAFFDQGFQMMYSFAKPEAVRSFREAWKRDPECAICYWGEGVGVGLVPERADDRRGIAARVRRGAEGAVAEEPRHAEGARAHRRHGGSLRREVRRGQARRAGSRLCRRDAEGRRRSIPTISRSPRSTPTRSSCSSRAAARAT